MNQKVVFTNGCFDIVHRMHLELLSFCRNGLDSKKVIVGLNSDDSVRKLKGDSRPIFDEEDRKFLLESLEYVDEVILFDEETPYNLIKELKPDVIVKGGDYLSHEVVGSDLCEVVIFPYSDKYSTTKAIKKLGAKL
tara:strand:- start:647 stop:1054 length:408 start_codon:yes stop_codon:yes gene_type:complete